MPPDTALGKVKLIRRFGPSKRLIWKLFIRSLIILRPAVVASFLAKSTRLRRHVLPCNLSSCPVFRSLRSQAVSAYRSALEVRTREQLPQHWATTQNNLGIALRDEAARTEGI